MRHPTNVLKLFMFFLVGGIAGVVYYLAGIVPLELLPWVIILAGIGAVACVTVMTPPRS